MPCFRRVGRRMIRRVGLTLGASMLLLAGCISPERAVREADEAGVKIAAQAMSDVAGRDGGFAIERPADRLRARLLAEKRLSQDIRGELEDTCVERRSEMPLRLSLADALRIGAENDNGYQSKKEAVFLAALDLDLARHEFERTFVGVLGGGAERSAVRGGNSSGGHESLLKGEGKMSVARKFKNGAEAMASLGLDIVKLLTGAGGRTLGLTGDVSMTVPLLRGSGRLVATEGLTQSERDLVYAIYELEEYRQDYAVDVATAYYGLLKSEQNLKALRENGERLQSNVDRAQMLYEAGRRSQVELDQTRQDLLSTGDKIVSAEKTRQAALDTFAMTLGLPAKTPLVLDMAELEKLHDGMREPRVDEKNAIEQALSNRFSIVAGRMKLEDAERAVSLARDGLRAGLDLKTGASLIQTRRTGEAHGENSKVAAVLETDLPWERTRERNAYRAALIAFDAAERAQEREEDATVRTIRDDIRGLNSAWSSYEIQCQALEVAKRRVESTTLFQQAGRSSTRDMLESEAALLTARNSLVAAIVDYTVAGLKLKRDMSSLKITDEGLIENSTIPLEPVARDERDEKGEANED